MRIQHLYISEYKNLKNFTLDFDGTSFIDVFVGKNGTGKSNLFEALIEIFRHLYESDYKEIKFDYTLQYTIDETVVQINWKWEKEQFVDADGKEAKKVTKKVLPDNILIYYSGHNLKVNELILDYENKFKAKVKGANPLDTREFIGIGKDYKSLLLSVLLIQPDQNKAKQFIIEKLGIKKLGSVLKIILQRPNYAIDNKFDVDQYVPETRYWGAKGITQGFLDKIETDSS